MPAVSEKTYSIGVPVEVAKIDHELKKLWRESEGAATRASLMNLAVYSEAPGSLNSNTQLMARITEDHACRAIVIEADCKAEDDGVDAWISAHCHVSRAGSKHLVEGRKGAAQGFGNTGADVQDSQAEENAPEVALLAGFDAVEKVLG